MIRKSFTLRDAELSDVPAMHAIRLAVQENRLTDPGRISEADYLPLLGSEGRGWVAEAGGRLAGFAILNISARNVWALFVNPACEGLGIGRALHDRMLRWSMANGVSRLWLSTGSGTRAERFYVAAGWTRKNLDGAGEVLFERQLEHRPSSG